MRKKSIGMKFGALDEEKVEQDEGVEGN